MLSSRDRAFTLTEFILVIALLGLLAILVTAGLGQAKKQSITSQCIGNLRTIQLGLNHFISDRGFYPGMRVNTRPTTWHHALEPYITGAPVPASNAPAAVWARCPGKSPDPSGPRGYGYNQFFGNIPPTASDYSENSAHGAYWNLRPAQIVEPSKKVVIGDGRDDGVTSGFTTNALRVSANANDPLLPRRHAEGGYYLFADGHVEHLSAIKFAERVRVESDHFLKPF